MERGEAVGLIPAACIWGEESASAKLDAESAEAFATVVDRCEAEASDCCCC